MLIRKTQQPSDYPSNQIHDAYSTSTTDTYSCNYINNQRPKTIYTGSLKGGSSVTLSNVKRFLDIYVHIDFAAVDGTIKYTIDTIVGNNVFSSGIMSPFDESGMTSYYVSESGYNKTTNVFTHRRIGYFNITNGSYVDRNNNVGYIVYRIDTYD